MTQFRTSRQFYLCRWYLFFVLVAGMLPLLSACGAEPTPSPTPLPTPTRQVALPQNQNVDTLNAAKAALGSAEFGFASLLQHQDTKVVIENRPEGEVARLAYPLQPAEPEEWSAVDSFVLSYALQKHLLQSPQVLSVALGQFGVAAPLADLQDHVDHVAVWARFSDGSQAVVDFSPLASSYGSLHTATRLFTDSTEIERQFSEWRQGVPLDLLQPLKVIKENNSTYYLLTHLIVTPERYNFALGVYLTQTATPIQPLNLTRGNMAQVEINRSDFEALRELLLADGPEAFNQRPELLNRLGDNDPALQAVLDEHLPLLWHLVTKLELPATLPPTSTPAPTATPTPTPTRPALPQETS